MGAWEGEREPAQGNVVLRKGTVALHDGVFDTGVGERVGVQVKRTPDEPCQSASGGQTVVARQ